VSFTENVKIVAAIATSASATICIDALALCRQRRRRRLTDAMANAKHRHHVESGDTHHVLYAMVNATATLASKEAMQRYGKQCRAALSPHAMVGNYYTRPRKGLIAG